MRDLDISDCQLTRGSTTGLDEDEYEYVSMRRCEPASTIVANKINESLLASTEILRTPVIPLQRARDHQIPEVLR